MILFHNFPPWPASRGSSEQDPANPTPFWWKTQQGPQRSQAAGKQSTAYFQNQTHVYKIISPIHGCRSKLTKSQDRSTKDAIKLQSLCRFLFSMMNISTLHHPYSLPYSKPAEGRKQKRLHGEATERHQKGISKQNCLHQTEIKSGRKGQDLLPVEGSSTICLHGTAKKNFLMFPLTTLLTLVGYNSLKISKVGWARSCKVVGGLKVIIDTWTWNEWGTKQKFLEEIQFPISIRGVAFFIG